MIRVLSLVAVLLVTAAAPGPRDLAAQTPPQAPVRDPSAQPNVRQIPVGTASISGTVVTADTGRPIRGVRVSLSGMSPSMSALGAGAAGVTPAPYTVAPIGRGGVGGQVVGGVAGQVPGAFASSSSLSRTVLTDAQGQFSFQKLPAGQFTLSANRSQYLSTTYGQKRPGGQGTQIQLADGQQMRVALKMIRAGVITGTVFGEEGEPVAFAQVRAWRQTLASGFPRLQQTGGGSTDDRGQYRLFGLEPGQYIVSAAPAMVDTLPDRMKMEMAAIEQAIASGAVQPPTAPGFPATVSISLPPPQTRPEPMPGYLPTYYPNTLLSAQASAIQVGAGEERSGVDIQVQLARASTIVGSVATPLPPGVTVQVQLLNDDPTTLGMSSPSARPGPDGRFTFRNIAPGQYRLMAQTVAAPPPPPPPVPGGSPVTFSAPPQPMRLDDSQRMWGRADVTVDPDSTANVTMGLQSGRSISGVVLFEMAKPPDLSRSRLTVTLTNAPSAQPSFSFSQASQAQVGPDGRFTLNGVIPGRYILRSSAGPMKSAVVGGQDTLDFPVDFTGERDLNDAVLTVTDKTTGLSGMLTDPSGKPAVDYTIVVAPADTRFWMPASRRISITRPDTSGRYTFRSLPPGEYFLAAVTDLDQGRQYDPEFLKTLGAASVRVTLNEGASFSQDLRVGR